MTVWFTSDWHIDHAAAVYWRPWSTVEEMLDVLVARCNDRVKPNDMLYILGDGVMGDRSISIPKIARFNGYKVYIPGNHDEGILPKNYDKPSYPRKREAYLEVVDDIVDLIWNLDEFVLSHFPYYEGELDHRGRDFSEESPRDHGQVLLCGHMHEEWAEKYTKNGTLMINVGVDVRDYAPISLDEIREIVKAKAIARDGL